MQELADCGINFWNAIAVGFGAIGGGDSRGVQQIFSTPGNAVKRAAIFSGGDFRVGLLGLREGQIFGERDDAAEFRIELLETLQIDLREALGSDLVSLDPAREAGNRSGGYFVFVFWERGGVGFCAGELVAIRGGLAAGGGGSSTGGQSDGGGGIRI